MSRKATFRYRFLVGSRVVHTGITTDLQRRQREHQRRWPGDASNRSANPPPTRTHGSGNDDKLAALHRPTPPDAPPFPSSLVTSTDRPRHVYVTGAGFTLAFVPGAPLLVDDFENDRLVDAVRGLPMASGLLEVERNRNRTVSSMSSV